MQGIPVRATLAIGAAVGSGTAYRLLYVDASGNLGQVAGLTFGGAAAGTGLALPAGTATTAVSPLAVTQTLNNAGILFPGATLTYTATAFAANSLALNILGGAAGTSPLFAVLQSGNVGIGTTSPTSSLTVNTTGTNAITTLGGNVALNTQVIGSVSATAIVTSGATVLGAVAPTGQNAFLRILGGKGATESGLVIGNDDTGTFYANTGQSPSFASDYGAFIFNNATNQFSLFQNFSSGYLGLGAGGRKSDLVILATSGNVGIGTASPAHLLSLKSAGVLGWEVSAGTDDIGISRISAGLFGFGTGTAASFAARVKLTSTITAAVAVGSLNASPTIGEVQTVNDALAVTVKGATVANGGSAVCQVMWNGSNWVGI